MKEQELGHGRFTESHQGVLGSGQTLHLVVSGNDSR